MRAQLLAPVSAVGAALFMWLLAALGTSHLNPGSRATVLLVLVAVAFGVGGITGLLISRRREDQHSVLFGVTAGAAAGAICGAAYALLMGISYVSTFGGTPVGAEDWIVVLLSYPVFAALGACAGAVPGGVLGALGGYLASR